jgi:hypothetical protein
MQIYIIFVCIYNIQQINILINIELFLYIGYKYRFIFDNNIIKSLFTFYFFLIMKRLLLSFFFSKEIKKNKMNFDMMMMMMKLAMILTIFKYLSIFNCIYIKKI